MTCNKKLFFLFFILCLGLIFWGLSNTYVAPILMYHSIDYASVYKTDTISPENFQRQMVFIQNHGYKVIPLDDLAVDRRRPQR